MYMSINKLIVLLQKNRVMIKEWPWIVICITYQNNEKMTKTKNTKIGETIKRKCV